MIKFFRNIRQNLLSEGNAVKYLKYAIGEILLVVIGILIAVSINNWNENRKNQVLIENYKERLINDLTKDSIQISNSINVIKSRSTKLEDYKKRISEASAPLDTLLKIARYEFNFLIPIHPDFNNDTYNVLISTGDIDIFKSEIINDLNVLNNIHEDVVRLANQTFEIYLNNLTWYVQKYPISYQSSLLANGTKAADIIWEQISLRQHATEFNSVVMRQGDSYRLSLRSLTNALYITNNLLVKMREL